MKVYKNIEEMGAVDKVWRSYCLRGERKRKDHDIASCFTCGRRHVGYDNGKH